MVSRRALIVAPLYDGQWLPPLPGRTLLVERLGECLKTFGGYDVKALDGLVEEDKFRVELKRFFDTDGELLFYFYGHGCLRDPGFGVFAVSSARPDKEGVLMAEVTAFANLSLAREVVLILDCCHAGAAVPATNDAIRNATSQLVAGRGLLAGCAAHQQGWTANLS